MEGEGLRGEIAPTFMNGIAGLLLIINKHFLQTPELVVFAPVRTVNILRIQYYMRNISFILFSVSSDNIFIRTFSSPISLLRQQFLHLSFHYEFLTSLYHPPSFHPTPPLEHWPPSRFVSLPACF